MNFLNECKQSGILPNDFAELEELYVKKLWHQLTLKCHEVVQKPELKQGNLLLELYEKFIADFEHRINPLSLVEICLPVVRQIQNPEQAVKFLEKLKEKVKYEQQPSILCNTAIGAIYLEQKNFEQTKKCVEETEQELNELDGVTSVHARFYELSSNYYRTIGNHCEYYKNALRYLGCIKFETLPVNEHKERAFYLSLAAILGEGIYNFGELLQHQILTSLNGTPDHWLVELLFAFNRGDLDKFEQLRPQWTQQADLKAAEVKMRQKICLLCLMEMAFNRPASNKQLSFNDISNKTKLPEEEIELLVMRALSLGLVKGSIDQIDRRVFISWVQPRVLDVNQIKMMRSRLDAWSSEMNEKETSENKIDFDDIFKVLPIDEELEAKTLGKYLQINEKLIQLSRHFKQHHKTIIKNEEMYYENLARIDKLKTERIKQQVVNRSNEPTKDEVNAFMKTDLGKTIYYLSREINKK